MKTVNVMVPLAALVAGAALGYFAPHGEKTLSAEQEKVAEAKPTAADNAELESLRKQNESLVRELAEMRNRLAKQSAKASSDGKKSADAKEGKDPFGKIDDDIAKWKKDNPELADEARASLKDFAAKLTNPTESKLDFLASLDTSWMSEEDKASYDDLMRLLAKQKEIQAKMFSLDISQLERIQASVEYMSSTGAIKKRGGQMRKALLRRTVDVLGYSGDAASEIVDTVDGIYTATTEDNLFSTIGGMVNDMNGGELSGDDAKDMIDMMKEDDSPVGSMPVRHIQQENEPTGN